MKNVYPATRPTWSEMEKSETTLIVIASILFALTGALGEFLVHDIILPRYHIDATLLHGIWSVLDVIMLTSACLLMIRYYKKLRIGCYPTTFLYCFSIPEASNPDGKRQVVGYCHVSPNLESGEIAVRGASFFWENGQLNIDSRVGFTSSDVSGSKEAEETTCHIRFHINQADSAKRFYKSGLLQFRLDKTTGLSAERGVDVYAGYLQAADVGVRSKGFAEWYGKEPLREGEEEKVQDRLRIRGGGLVSSLQAMQRATPPPTLWQEQGSNGAENMQTNFWGHQIPTPQSVVLNDEFRPYIDRLLSKMLSLSGLDEPAIARFKTLVRNKAIDNREDTRVAYERDLKAGLIGMTKPWKLNATLNQRARIIKSQIEPFLVGDSLLDIGCGNGMISSLMKNHFKEIQLLDVVRYLPEELQLPFDLYKEGDRLPVKKSFDTVLLLTVLHHSSNPVELLKLAWGATAKNLIIIESVIGIYELAPGVNYELVNCSEEMQIGYAAFIDWFYNRVLHSDVPVPYNFTTPDRWQSVFMQHGMHLMQTRHFGQDIDIGPEYHVLFMLQKE